MLAGVRGQEVTDVSGYEVDMTSSQSSSLLTWVVLIMVAPVWILLIFFCFDSIFRWLQSLPPRRNTHILERAWRGYAPVAAVGVPVFAYLDLANYPPSPPLAPPSSSSGAPSSSGDALFVAQPRMLLVNNDVTEEQDARLRDGPTRRFRRDASSHGAPTRTNMGIFADRVPLQEGEIFPMHLEKILAFPREPYQSEQDHATHIEDHLEQQALLGYYNFQLWDPSEMTRDDQMVHREASGALALFSRRQMDANGVRRVDHTDVTYGFGTPAKSIFHGANDAAYDDSCTEEEYYRRVGQGVNALVEL